eukprot:gnl/TRDRNA2_/TRDRNA2_206907_c0_seq1.p1 gnl/TRDRNA2_/TRDRNA2_206907_c0~~gnl/TRDRNA2_/TRDRNA2_206907_c0_seq1.p1  ORF type:complete len:103 (+),score=7.34 gnl/TRDRNA2_/TRDRNA2_206907_c0_seq1:188-496(+)
MWILLGPRNLASEQRRTTSLSGRLACHQTTVNRIRTKAQRLPPKHLESAYDSLKCIDDSLSSNPTYNLVQTCIKASLNLDLQDSFFWQTVSGAKHRVRCEAP